MLLVKKSCVPNSRTLLVIHPPERIYSFKLLTIYVTLRSTPCNLYYNDRPVSIKYLKNDTVTNTERIVKKILSLPIYQGMKIEDVDKIVNLLNNY